MLEFLKIMLDGQRVKSERGATAVEYGLLVALIAAAIIVIVATLGDELNEMFTDVNSQVNAR